MFDNWSSENVALSRRTNAAGVQRFKIDLSLERRAESRNLEVLLPDRFLYIHSAPHEDSGECEVSIDFGSGRDLLKNSFFMAPGTARNFPAQKITVANRSQPGKFAYIEVSDVLALTNQQDAALFLGDVNPNVQNVYEHNNRFQRDRDWRNRFLITQGNETSVDLTDRNILAEYELMFEDEIQHQIITRQWRELNTDGEDFQGRNATLVAGLISQYYPSFLQFNSPSGHFSGAARIDDKIFSFSNIQLLNELGLNFNAMYWGYIDVIGRIANPATGNAFHLFSVSTINNHGNSSSFDIYREPRIQCPPVGDTHREIYSGSDGSGSEVFYTKYAITPRLAAIPSFSPSGVAVSMAMDGHFINGDADTSNLDLDITLNLNYFCLSSKPVG